MASQPASAARVLSVLLCGLIVVVGCDTKHQNPPGGSGPNPPPVSQGAGGAVDPGTSTQQTTPSTSNPGGVTTPSSGGTGGPAVPDKSGTPSGNPSSTPGGSTTPGGPTTPSGSSTPGGSTTPGAAYVPEKLENVPHLPNAFRVHEKVVSGGLPEGEAGFKELQELGIKTILSVDGATPDVELAKKYGLRYVHLPHSYDGVPEGRATELAKAVKELPGPIYIHCHHGKHRSPAASAVACIGAGLLPRTAALTILTTAGTSPNYRGLYQSADVAKPIDPKVLSELQVEFREQVPVPALAKAMVEVEHFHDHLKALSANKWQLLADHPALTPAHEALLLREAYTELLRTTDTLKRPKEYQTMLQAAEQTADELEKVFISAKDQPLEEVRAAALFTKATEQCSTCHKKFRDVPLNEK